MPITKSALKSLRQDHRRAKVNHAIKLNYRALVKKAQRQPTLTNLKKAYSALDRAAKKKVIHKNKAARLKSRLAKKKSK